MGLKFYYKNWHQKVTWPCHMALLFAVHKAVYLAGFLYYMAVGWHACSRVHIFTDMLERTYIMALPWGLIPLPTWWHKSEMLEYIGTVLLMAVSPPPALLTRDNGLTCTRIDSSMSDLNSISSCMVRRSESSQNDWMIFSMSMLRGWRTSRTKWLGDRDWVTSHVIGVEARYEAKVVQDMRHQ